MKSKKWMDRVRTVHATRCWRLERLKKAVPPNEVFKSARALDRARTFP